MQLIPSIDLRGGHSVRLYQGDFAQETRYQHTPQMLLDKYADMGASWLHIVDLDGARDGALANREIIAALAAKRRVRLQVGGGVRSSEAIEDLLRCGVARVVLGSAAVETPDLAISWLEKYGGERVCVAFDVKIDARQIPRLFTRGWTQGTAVSLWDITAPFQAAGLKHLLCTDIERDGALAGPNVELYRDAVGRFPQLAWQASGGVRHAGDLRALAAVGCAAAISGKALLEQRMTAAELQAFLPGGAPAAKPAANTESR